MVRVLVGTLLLVGRGAWPASRLDAPLRGPRAPPTGLPRPTGSLVGVAYDPPEPRHVRGPR
jgi:tRNA U38,U39,U40 pseudouridine synthase TruA